MLTKTQEAALEAFDQLKPPFSTIRECYARMPDVRKAIEEAFSAERIDTAPPPYQSSDCTYRKDQTIALEEFDKVASEVSPWHKDIDFDKLRKQIQAGFTEQFDQDAIHATMPELPRPLIRHTHTYTTLDVSEATFNDVRDRMLKAYSFQDSWKGYKPSTPETWGNNDSEHYLERDDRGRGKVVRVLMGQVALQREESSTKDKTSAC